MSQHIIIIIDHPWIQKIPSSSVTAGSSKCCTQHKYHWSDCYDLKKSNDHGMAYKIKPLPPGLHSRGYWWVSGSKWVDSPNSNDEINQKTNCERHVLKHDSNSVLVSDHFDEQISPHLTPFSENLTPFIRNLNIFFILGTFYFCLNETRTHEGPTYNRHLESVQSNEKIKLKSQRYSLWMEHNFNFNTNSTSNQ